MQIPNCRWKMLSLIYSWWIRRADWIFIEKYPHVSEAVQFKWVLLKGQLYFCRWHRPGSESVGLAWPPDAIAMTQGKPGLEDSEKGCAKEQFSPAAECVFPSTSLTFCEALPAHLGTPEREEHPQGTRMLGSSSKRRE